MQPLPVTAATLTLALSVSFALAAVSLDATVDTYEVSGTTFPQIMRSLQENAPYIERTKRRHYGVTRLSFTQEATFQEARDGCELLSNDIGLKVEMVLPEWIDRDRAADGVAARWDRLSESIAAHEERHVAIAQDYLRRMRRELDRAMTAPTCERLRAMIRTRMEALIEQHRAAQEGFDEEVRQQNAGSGEAGQRG